MRAPHRVWVALLWLAGWLCHAPAGAEEARRVVVADWAAGLLLAVNLAAVGSGAMPVGWRELLALAGQPLGFEADLSEPVRAVLLQVRLPRIVLALLAGAGLAVCGAVLQALFRNPLADPGLLGISSGAALGAGLMIVAAPAGLLAGWHGFAVPLAAFLGALAATGAVLVLAGRQARWAPSTTLLAGIAVNALAGAGIGLLSWLADEAILGPAFAAEVLVGRHPKLDCPWIATLPNTKPL